MIKDTTARNVRMKIHNSEKKHANQVKLARDRSQNYITIQAEKRKLFRESNLETNSKLKNERRDLEEVKLRTYEQK